MTVPAIRDKGHSLRLWGREAYSRQDSYPNQAMIRAWLKQAFFQSQVLDMGSQPYTKGHFKSQKFDRESMGFINS